MTRRPRNSPYSNRMIISLTGFMGCGKSSVGKTLSALLGCPFTDLDAAIVERIGCTIPEYFALHGEAAFRALESDVLSATLSGYTLTGDSLSGHSLSGDSLSGHSLPHLAPKKEGKCRSTREGASDGMLSAISAVLALGGGTVMTPDCAEQVHTQTCCIYLRASLDTLVERLRNEAAGRPMLRARTPVPGTEACPGSRPAPADTDKALRERISHLLAQRSATYESVAHHIIDVDGLSIEDVARTILSSL